MAALKFFVPEILACALGLAAGYYSMPWVAGFPSVPGMAVRVAGSLCSANDGLQAIEPRGDRKYQVVCANGAHFLDVAIHDKDGK